MNKTVLITGASSGIGLELAKIFARNNYDLVIVSQDETKLKVAHSILKQENAAINITALSKDLSMSYAAEEIFDYLKEQSIAIDILVNNAGIQVYGNFHDADINDTLALLNVNLMTLTKLTRLFMTEMINKGSGRILNLGSTGSFQPVPLNAAYCASKAYVLHLSEGIAKELKGTGVTITTLCPGATKTNFAKRSHIEDIRLFKHFLMKPEIVAQIGYKALISGKPVVVAGTFNKISVFLLRFLPRTVACYIGMQLMKK